VIRIQSLLADGSPGGSTRDMIAELKARYEHKMKRLIQEIGKLRRKYNEVTHFTETSNFEKYDKYITEK
jgi:muconolactone delta-isomerase